MAGPTVTIQGSIQNGEHILTVTLTDNEPSRSGKSFGLSVSDYGGFPDPNQPGTFSADQSQPCGWNLQSANLGNFSATFYAVLAIPPGDPFPNQVEWTLAYSSGESVGQWSAVTQ